jgi:NAD(P)H-hydrate epimerase
MTHTRHYPTVPLYRAESVRELDRLAIERHGINGYDLMRRAGRRAFEILRGRWPEARAVTICCGGGNNGGDGYVMARLAREADLSVQLIAMKSPDELAGTARQAADDWRAIGGTIEQPDERLRGDVIVDALLGTGLDRPVRDDYARLIAHINDAGRPVLAVDVPSGLHADTGTPLGHCVRADATVTFIGRKRGLYTGQAGRWCGAVLFDDLGTPAEIHAAIEADAALLGPAFLRHRLPPRPADTHKGDLGRLLVVGGNHGMAGAPVLAGRAALRSGSGLVTLATRSAHATLAPSVQPELMSHGVETDALEAFEPLIEGCDVVALGPGLGQDDWAKALWRRSIEHDCPLVVDADALNLLAAEPTRRENWILTPHPGEAARLLGVKIAEVQSDRFAAASSLAEHFDAVVILKGHGSLVAGPGATVAVCPYGNPAMATAGMGDALTGIVASLLGQGLAPFDAACSGVLLHALAGDRAARGRRQIVAGDLVDALWRVLPA